MQPFAYYLSLVELYSWTSENFMRLTLGIIQSDLPWYNAHHGSHDSTSELLPLNDAIVRLLVWYVIPDVDD